MATYRDSDEWRAVEQAVSNLAMSVLGEDYRAGDFVLCVHSMPMTDQAEHLGHYGHFSTSVLPHVNRGLLIESDEYWGELAGSDEDE
ncbi:hypothetical protein ACIQYW_18995 [Rhodococcus erythropolis]|uniref:hypothetical protein n=2 Tax=Actinomycetota TaxID=201174 RepID=UPI00038F398D|nr:hypothetical protein N806_20180 [Rhodococcus sp. P27]